MHLFLFLFILAAI